MAHTPSSKLADATAAVEQKEGQSGAESTEQTAAKKAAKRGKRAREDDSQAWVQVKKGRGGKSTYAAPSNYAHLSPLVDILEPGLVGVFVGFNPGVTTAIAGHAYAHPSNHFWRLLHSSGITDRRLAPRDDRSLPALYAMGNTNIVSRPSKDTAELSKQEMAAGTADIDAKCLLYKPEAVCIVGKGIWEAVWRYRFHRSMKQDEFHYGWQDPEHNLGKGKFGETVLDRQGKVWRGARVFVATATSGLAASLSMKQKEEIWRRFGEWVEKRREERGFVPSVVEKDGEEEEEEGKDDV